MAFVRCIEVYSAAVDKGDKTFDARWTEPSWVCKDVINIAAERDPLFARAMKANLGGKLLPPKAAKSIFVRTEDGFKGGTRHGAPDGGSGDLVKELVAESVPSELEKGPHAYHDFAKEENGSIKQRVFDPSSKASGAPGRAHGRNSRVLTIGESTCGLLNYFN